LTCRDGKPATLFASDLFGLSVGCLKAGVLPNEFGGKPAAPQTRLKGHDTTHDSLPSRVKTDVHKVR
jgi:hypothetical protein